MSNKMRGEGVAPALRILAFLWVAMIAKILHDSIAR